MPEPVRWDVRRFPSLGSTNDYLRAEARAGSPEGLVAVADHQTAGRGRRGRSWEAPPGSSLLMSVLLRPVLRPEDLHLCTAAVALAAADACADVAGVPAELKWPNDLVVGGSKLAGVLAEADAAAPGGQPGSTAVVVGIGLNIDWPGPPEAGGTCLGQLTGASVDRDELLGGLLTGLGVRREALDSAAGRSRLLNEVRARCVTVGQRVRATLARQTLEGTATGIDDGGRLQVLVGASVHAVSAGDVVHLRPEPSDPR